MKRLGFSIIFLSAPILLAACSTVAETTGSVGDALGEAVVSVFADEAPEEVTLEDTTTPAGVLYNDAQDLLEKKKYKASAQKFLEVERQHPYSKWAPNAQVQAAYAFFKNESFDDSVNTLERFVKLNPGNKDVPYAYYLIALNYYNQISNVERDQQMTLNARQALNDVINRFPETDYARDAKWKIDLVEDHLAGKEMAIGRYYLEKRQYIGAINRFQKVVEDYPTTAQVEEALHRLTEAYLAMGITPEAQKYAAVLGHNYPGSEWYQDSYDLLLHGEIKQDNRGKAPNQKEAAWWEVWNNKYW